MPADLRLGLDLLSIKWTSRAAFAALEAAVTATWWQDVAAA
eukprot:CAMPEP_0204564764 /NCGR_PEP_ID=MMETSP0661-20131031/35083_1 /ASSEMBLY_ACC=CAM_ASM_000606 /TAXON_ID=109239 /ORGANISM="Alexandrium margalefi, Strain AMGDE01CS-322" /LENGTH=40 /DNA_ID= /DNA_START= /DNA_END= /DNA_ORIENTATION=